jgi:hypothetical protein
VVGHVRVQRNSSWSKTVGLHEHGKHLVSSRLVRRLHHAPVRQAGTVPNRTLLYGRLLTRGVGWTGPLDL